MKNQTRNTLTNQEMHWLTYARRLLIAKIMNISLPFSAESVNGNDTRIVNTITKNLVRVSDKQKADLLVYREVYEKEELQKLTEKCNEGGLIFCCNNKKLNRSDFEDFIRNLENSGFEIENVLYFGFFVKILTWPFRLFGFQIDEDKTPGFGINRLFRQVVWFESLFLPYVRFITGESLMIVAKHLTPEPHIKYDLSIIIPAYNEEKRILPYLNSIEKYVNSLKSRKIEVLVVNDGSRDGTLDVVKSNFKDIKVISLYKNFGKGGAIREGIQLSRGERILIADADGSTPITELDKLMEWMNKGKDIAIGSRYMSHSEIIIKQSLLRRILSRAGNLLIRVVMGLPYKDTQCGFKLFHVVAARFLFKELRNNRFGFDFEILKKARQNHFTVVELPVIWRDTEGSKVTIKESFRTLWDLFYLQFAELFFFSIAGVLNTIIDYSVYNTLIFTIGMGDSIRQTLYNGIGFISANMFSYIFNSSLTFRAHGAYLRFFSVSFIALLLSTISFYGLNVMFNPENKLILANILKLSTVVISMLVNYVGYKYIVFSKEK